MYNHQNNTFISHQIFHLFSGHVRPLTVENFGCWDIPFVWGLPNLEFGQIPPNSPNLTIWPGSFLRLVGTYLAAGYCNCNEALFPLSTLSQQENSLEQREGGGRGWMSWRAWCPTPFGTCGHHISCPRENIERRCEDKCLPIVLKSLLQPLTCVGARKLWKAAISCFQLDCNVLQLSWGASSLGSSFPWRALATTSGSQPQEHLGLDHFYGRRSHRLLFQRVSFAAQYRTSSGLPEFPASPELWHRMWNGGLGQPVVATLRPACDLSLINLSERGHSGYDTFKRGLQEDGNFVLN